MAVRPVVGLIIQVIFLGDNDPPGMIGDAAEAGRPALKRRTRTAMITATTKAKQDEAKSAVGGLVGRTRRAPTPSTVNPPLHWALIRLECLRRGRKRVR
ncbi:hypothetical protein BKA82DRAFT_1002742 [Pisolithus tinctorius]|uniref:Uncharacterized protein n=1 Tax=Pisolithus tinctorius Marx 270 TaxID=870435 RepID=A0A0C3P3D3_PISTI|nr:hypothetical protein BKA82DRAFT_1002742 [Pisolithus tinctorius]KIO01981.1 hypothetical protein M404DRAFT_1002742 [Pisolithus tinctorius Marx 270]